MKMCKACQEVQRVNGWYLGSDDKLASAQQCEAHPVMTNSRVIRTLKTLRTWSLEAKGFQMTVGAPGSFITNKVTIHLGGGHIHQRNAYLVLFDYEQPFVDLLVREGYLQRHKCVRTPLETRPVTLSVTAKGDELIRGTLVLDEAKGVWKR